MRFPPNFPPGFFVRTCRYGRNSAGKTARRAPRLPYRASRGIYQLAAPFAPDAGTLGACRRKRGIGGGKFALPLGKFMCGDAQKCGRGNLIFHGSGLIYGCKKRRTGSRYAAICHDAPPHTVDIVSCRLCPLSYGLYMQAVRGAGIEAHGQIRVERAAEPVLLRLLARSLLSSLLEHFRAVRAHGVRLGACVALFGNEEPVPRFLPILPRKEFYPAVMDVEDDPALHGLADDAAQKGGGLAVAHDFGTTGGDGDEKLRFGVVNFGHSYPVKLAIIAYDLMRFHGFAVFAVRNSAGENRFASGHNAPAIPAGKFSLRMRFTLLRMT